MAFNSVTVHIGFSLLMVSYSSYVVDVKRCVQCACLSLLKGLLNDHLCHTEVSLCSVFVIILCIYFEDFTRTRPAYLYQFSRNIPILALNHDFPISCGGVPVLEDAGIFRARRFRFVLFSPVFRRFLILSASCTYRQSRRCVAAINSPPGAMSQC